MSGSARAVASDVGPDSMRQRELEPFKRAFQVPSRTAEDDGEALSYVDEKFKDIWLGKGAARSFVLLKHWRQIGASFLPPTSIPRLQPCTWSQSCSRRNALKNLLELPYVPLQRRRSSSMRRWLPLVAFDSFMRPKSQQCLRLWIVSAVITRQIYHGFEAAKHQGGG